MRNKTFLFLILISSLLIGCNPVPPEGHAIYCQSCDENIFYRTLGTTGTAFRPSEWVSLVFDVPVPVYVNDKFECPLCGHSLVKEKNADLETVAFYSRPMSGW